MKFDTTIRDKMKFDTTIRDKMKFDTTIRNKLTELQYDETFSSESVA